MYEINRTDYICIGGNGFAQFGDPLQYQKDKAEKEILMPYIEETLPIPEEFAGLAWYSWKKFPYEGGAYFEACIIYYREIIEKFEESDSDKFDRFYAWANAAEGIDLETEELTEKIMIKFKELYPQLIKETETINLKIVHKRTA